MDFYEFIKEKVEQKLKENSEYIKLKDLHLQYKEFYRYAYAYVSIEDDEVSYFSYYNESYLDNVDEKIANYEKKLQEKEIELQNLKEEEKKSKSFLAKFRKSKNSENIAKIEKEIKSLKSEISELKTRKNAKDKIDKLFSENSEFSKEDIKNPQKILTKIEKDTILQVINENGDNPVIEDEVVKAIRNGGEYEPLVHKYGGEIERNIYGETARKIIYDQAKAMLREEYREKVDKVKERIENIEETENEDE